MQPGQARLAIDAGTASTVAILTWPDGRAVPLTFDAAAELPAGV